MTGRLAVLITATLLTLSTVLPALAQEIQLSPVQRQMLDSLPPAQRQQALAALRQLNSQQQGDAQQSINETLTDPESVLNDESLLPSLEEEMRAAGRSRIALSFAIAEDLSPRQVRQLQQDDALQRLLGNHLFVLDEDGVLPLLGIENVPLLGLTEVEIVRRLLSVPDLAVFEIDASILGYEAIGVEALQPFGYDVFEPRDSELTAPTSGPVPADYVLGPGDTVRVQLFGNVNGIYEYEVSRDGVLNLPEIGPVTVAGITFSEFRADVDNRVKEMLIGTQVSVTMGPLRTIRVFVLGDVNRPGSYVISGLATISSALYRSGGVASIGSLRRIQLKRGGRTITTFDAYDLLVRGDNSGDRRLQPGDVVFVPPIGKTVGVAGAVMRPAIYEVKSRTSAADLVGLAGGLAPDAFARGARLERIAANSTRSVIAVDLSSRSANEIIVSRGDTLIVPEVLPEVENAVTLAGHVFRPGNYPWRPGMRLSQLIRSADELRPGVDIDYLLIRRERHRGQPVVVLSASLADALASPGDDGDIELQPRDTVSVFSLAGGRQRIVQPLLEEMRSQATIDTPAAEVEISGMVRAPGEYPLEPGMRISDLIRAGGNLTEAAYALEAELTSYSISESGERITDVVKIDLQAVRNGDRVADMLLREHDYLIVNQVPDWDSVWSVTIEGEVRFPGTYRVRRGETLQEVVRRAGGLTDDAFAEGAVFLRESLKEQEQEQIETLARRLEADLASLSLQDVSTGGSDTLATGRVLLDQLRTSEAVGRLVVDLPQVLNGRSTEIEIRDGDQLLVPPRSQVVTVLGETQQNTSHVYQKGMARDDYIALSGGLTRRADKKLIYVVRANGAVVAANRSRWFGRGGRVDIRPGDTIVVPLDTDRMRPLTFWGNVTQILYQGAIAVAAIKTFDN